MFSQIKSNNKKITRIYKNYYSVKLNFNNIINYRNINERNKDKKNVSYKIMIYFKIFFYTAFENRIN